MEDAIPRASQELSEAAASLAAARAALRADSTLGSDSLTKQLVSVLSHKLVVIEDGARAAARQSQAGTFQPIAAHPLLANLAAATAFGSAALGRPGPSPVALVRWIELLDKALEDLTDVVPNGDTGDQVGDLPSLAADYVADAGLDGRRSARWSAAMLALVVTACVVAIVALFRLPSGGGTPLLGAHLAVSGIVLVAAVPAWLQAERHRRAAADATRLARQLAQLGPLLAPLEADARTVMRAAAMQRLFARPLGDDDPLREPVWPVPNDLFRVPSPNSALVPVATEAQGLVSPIGARARLRRWWGG